MDSRGCEESPIPCLSQQLAQRKSKMTNRSLDTQIQTSLLSVSRITQSGKISEPAAKHSLADRHSKTSEEAKESGLIQTSLFSTSSFKHSSKASKLVAKFLLAPSPSKPTDTIIVCHLCLERHSPAKLQKTPS